MKTFISILALVAFIGQAHATDGATNRTFMHKKCFAAGGVGSGGTQADPAAIADGDILVLPARTLVHNVEVIVSTAVTGSSPELLVGDDDDNDGYAAAADVTEGSAAVYNGAGAYLAAGAKKYYSATGKEVKFDLTGTASAGAFCVVVRGYRI